MVRLQIILALVLQALSPCARCEAFPCGDASCPPGVTCCSESCIAPCLTAGAPACCASARDSLCTDSTRAEDEAPCNPAEFCCDPACIAMLCRFSPASVVTRTDARTSGDADLDRALDVLLGSTPDHPMLTVAAPCVLTLPDAVDAPPLVRHVSRPVICIWIN